MDVFHALQQRRSVRAFCPRPSQRRYRARAHGGRCARCLGRQPATLARAGFDWRTLAQTLQAVAQAQPEAYANSLSYPPDLWEPYRTRRFANGEDLYRSIGIPRDDKAARLEQLGKTPNSLAPPWVCSFASTSAWACRSGWIWAFTCNR